MLACGEISEKGVLAPEGCVDPKGFLTRFAKRGFSFSETEAITQEARI
jgi:hypothetical protein